MNFLQKIGGIILKGVEVVMGFAPVVQQEFPGSAGAVSVISKDLTEIANVVTQVEAIGQALTIPGPQKLTAAAPLVAQVILQSSMMANHTIADSVKFQGGAQKIADGMADVLNSLHGNIDTTSKT